MAYFLKLRRKLGDSRAKVLLWATLASLIFALVEFGAPAEYGLERSRNLLRKHPASGQIVLIAVDDRSVATIDRWPWQPRDHARLIDALTKGGVARIFYASEIPASRDPSANRTLAEAIARNGARVRLGARAGLDQVTGKTTEYYSDPLFQGRSAQTNVNFQYDFTGSAWHLAYAASMGGKELPALGAAIAGVPGDAGSFYPLDYSIDLATFPTISAADVLAGKFAPDTLRGRDVVVANTSSETAATVLLPGYGLVPTPYIHLVGAETLREGRPLVLGWLPALAFGFAAAALALACTRPRAAALILAGAFATALTAPLLLEPVSIKIQIIPALFLIAVIGICLALQNWKAAHQQRGTINVVSGLPNLAALRQTVGLRNQILIVARIHNYAQIFTALPSSAEAELVENIAKRLTLGASIPQLYQGDEGIFAWFADRALEAGLKDHLNALHSLFHTPVNVGGNQVDLSISFGIEVGQGRSVANRLGSALVAADEAAAEGRKWKKYDAAKLEEAPWRLSILSQLDAAAESGDLWVAYQPKIDLVSREVTGAEALVRWTHPEKGPVSPLEFIPVAEQSGRIAGLTSFVLERSVRAGAFIHRDTPGFGVSVNLSAKLLTDLALDEQVAELLTRYRFPAQQLTLEVTETAALASGPDDLEPLHRLRAMGVQISIDDYGTGLSTLEYLRRIPATEIKVDQSFVQSIYKSHSDKLMVHSTIQLAHSLGQKVVAEGVEDAHTLEALAFMGCDVAQGYYIGRPVPFRDLVRALRAERRRRAA